MTGRERPGTGADPVRGLIDRLADGVLVVGSDGRIRYANPMAEQLLGRSAAELLGAPFGHPVVSGETTELELVTRDREAVTVEMRAVDTVWEGEPCHIASLRDVTARVEAESALARLNHELLTLHRIGQICLSRANLGDAFRDIVAEIAAATGFSAVAILRLDEGSPDLTVLAAHGFPPGTPDLDDAKGSLAGLVARQRRSVVISDVAQQTEPAAQGFAAAGFASCIGVPMTVGDGVRGCLVLASRSPVAIPATFIDWAETLAASVTSFTERVRISEQLASSEERFRRLAEHAPDVIYRYRLEPQAGFEYISPSCEVLTGYTPEELGADADPLRQLTHPDDRDQLDALLHPEGPAAPPVRLRWVRKDGTIVWTEQRRTTVHDEAGRLVAIEAIARVVTERTEFEARLAHQALHDALTGLPNRVLFLDRLEQALERLRRRRRLAAVLFLDVDNFKVINDGLGHEAGDRVLQEVAERLRPTLRPTDTVARFGGDEFAVLLEDLDTPSSAVAVGWRVLADLAPPVRVGGRQVFVSASIGVALVDDPDQTTASILRHADVAMYRAKEAGRGRLVVFDEHMALQALDRLELDHALHVALDNGELVLLYQPVVRLHTGQVTGFEALLRWDHPERGRLLPDTFLQIAEEAQLAAPISLWVLAEACCEARRWVDAQPSLSPPVVSVNLSVHQLAHPDLEQVVHRALDTSGLPGTHLCIEVTEQTVMQQADVAAARLAALRELGVHVALDDFGTGYSSLSRLRHLPVDTLKIDKSFVSGIGREHDDTAVVSAVIGLSQHLGLTVVAEGIETEIQRRTLLGLGCERGQGHLWAPAIPAGQAAALIGRRIPTVPASE